MDCQDSSCPFAENTNGMRTNGGCRCIEWERIPPNDRVKLRSFLREVRDLRKDLAIMTRVYERACDSQVEAQRERDAALWLVAIGACWSCWFSLDGYHPDAMIAMHDASLGALEALAVAGDERARRILEEAP